MSVDLQDHAAKSIYCKVGDGATTLEEYEFRVPPKKCSTSSIKFRLWKLQYNFTSDDMSVSFRTWAP